MYMSQDFVFGVRYDFAATLRSAILLTLQHCRQDFRAITLPAIGNVAGLPRSSLDVRRYWAKWPESSLLARV